MLQLPAKVNHDGADALASSLKSQVSAEAHTVSIDAQQLLEFDSSALAVLLACRRATLAAGKAFEVHHAPAKLAQLATLYGVAQLLGLAEPTIAAAPAV